MKPDPVDLKTVLYRHFAFPNFRPGQKDALEKILAGQDTLVVMPTGHGKSLIYQLAALLLPGTTIVISPLISLMKDQVDSLVRRDIAATFINSSLSSHQQRQILADVAAGYYKIVFVAPERLRSRAFLGALSGVPISLLVVDEAHCLSQWGHDFRPDYLRIAAMRRRFKQPVTLALTATATRRVQDDIARLLAIPNMARIITGFNRPNLSLEVLYATDVSAKLTLLDEFLDEPMGAGIIYAGTRRDTEEVADFLDEVTGIPARYYHAGLEPETRSTIQDAFMAGDLPLIVATNAFGMGIDRPDVRFVLHYTMPGSLEAYYQEAGRAGRDGLPARAVMLYSPKDTALHEYFIENDSPTARDLRSVHKFLAALPAGGIGDEAGPRVFHLDELTRSTGLPEVKVRVALEQLEAANALTRFPNEAGNLIRIQPGSLSEAALQKIAEQVEARRRHKYAMLDKMVTYAETNDCRRRLILKHFGDTGTAEAPVCCDNCISRIETKETGTRSAETQSERAALIALDTIAGLNLGKKKIVRILKGSAARDVARFTRHRHYGKFAGLRIHEIETLIDQLLRAGYLKTVGSRLPTLAISSKGEITLKARAAVQVELRPVRQGAAQRLKAEREAGGTIELTGQMLVNGLTPEQIAAERGLAMGTIYSHLAKLINAGKVHLDAVVPAEKQRLIRAAIKAAGSADSLAPIKARLPDTMDYGTIRCVVKAWKRESNPSDEHNPLKRSKQGAPPGQPVTAPFSRELFERLRAWRLQKARSLHKPAFLIFSDEALRGIASSYPKTRQELLSVRGIGPSKANQYGEEILGLVADYPAIRAADHTADNLPDQGRSDPISSFLSRPHPRVLKGPWLAGWALDFYSRFEGHQQVRGLIGDLVYRYKYAGQHQLAGELAGYWADLLAGHPELPPPVAVIPIPPSVPRDFDPVTCLAQALAGKLEIPVQSKVLVKSRPTRPQKELKSIAAKRANIAGAFALQANISGQHLLLVDDLYDSGATISEAACTLARGSPASIVVLTLTKTIHSDQ